VLSICEYVREREARGATRPDPRIYAELNRLEAEATTELDDLLQEQVRAARRRAI
jgi:hypothetical protein